MVVYLAEEIATIVAFVALLLAHTCSALCHAGKSSARLQELIALLPDSICRVSLFPGLSRKHKFSKLLNAKILADRLKYMQATIDLMSRVCCIPAVIIVYRIVLGARRWNTLEQDILILAGYAILTLGRFVRRLVNPKTLILWYSSGMVLLTAFALDADREAIQHFCALCSVAGLALSVCYLDLKVTFFWNAAQDLAMMVAFSLATPTPSKVEELSRRTVADFAAQRLQTLCAKVVVLYLVEKLLLGRLLREIEATEERGLRVACLSLLNNMCDAVVEIDSTQRIVKHEPRLAHMLFHGVGKCLQGAMLQDFIPNADDRKYFDESLSTERQDRAKMFHTVVKDTMGNHIRVQCFQVTYLSVDDELRHLVGLLEDYEPTRQDCSAPLPAPPTRQASSEDEASDSISEASDGDMAPRPSRLEQETALQVCVRGGRLEVVWASRPCRERFGAMSQGCDFLRWLPQDSAPTFVEWMSERLDGLYEGTVEPGIAEFGPLLVSTPGHESNRGRRLPRLVIGIFVDPDLYPERPATEDYKVTLLIGHKVRPLPHVGGLGTAALGSEGGDLCDLQSQASRGRGRSAIAL